MIPHIIPRIFPRIFYKGKNTGYFLPRQKRGKASIYKASAAFLKFGLYWTFKCAIIVAWEIKNSTPTYKPGNKPLFYTPPII